MKEGQNIRQNLSLTQPSNETKAAKILAPMSSRIRRQEKNRTRFLQDFFFVLTQKNESSCFFLRSKCQNFLFFFKVR
jgi:hypothetical protein